MSTEAEKSRALLKFCRALFGRKNLIGTDFKDASALKVNRPFVQGSGGVHIQFTVCWDAIGKVNSDGLYKLLPEDDEDYEK